MTETLFGTQTTCAACKAEFLGLETERLCPDCHADQALYLRTKGRRDPRRFLPYQELLKAWKARRADCAQWRKVAGNANEEVEKAHAAKKENAALRLAVDSATEALAAEVLKLREELASARRLLDSKLRMDRHTFSGVSPAIPLDRVRQIRSLCHPDRWCNQPQERSATEIMQWLNSLIA